MNFTNRLNGWITQALMLALIVAVTMIFGNQQSSKVEREAFEVSTTRELVSQENTLADVSKSLAELTKLVQAQQTPHVVPATQP